MVAITAVFTALILWQNRNPRPERTMNDPRFERAANAICSEKIPGLRAVRREDDTEDDLEEETARAVDRAATRLRAVVDELRALEVRPANQDQVAVWFGHFDDFLASGRRYADALRSGDPEVYDAVDDEAVAPLQAISRFARANHIDSCIP